MPGCCHCKRAIISHLEKVFGTTSNIRVEDIWRMLTIQVKILKCILKFTGNQGIVWLHQFKVLLQNFWRTELLVIKTSEETVTITKSMNNHLQFRIGHNGFYLKMLLTVQSDAPKSKMTPISFISVEQKMSEDFCAVLFVEWCRQGQQSDTKN